MGLSIKPDFEGERTDEEGGRHLLAVYSYKDVAAFLAHHGYAAPELVEGERCERGGCALADALGHDSAGWRACHAGQSFSHGAQARVLRKRVIVRQTIAWDI